MREALKARAGRMVGGRKNDQHIAALAVFVHSPTAVKDTFAVLPQDLSVTVRVRNIQRMRHHARALSASRRNRTRSAEKCQPSLDFALSEMRRTRLVVSSNLARFAGLYSQQRHTWRK